ncbi:hypothetical protein Leryth_016452 [Lithospermum erythrorhizon]|nr:hypothetical protein Leryth_016452 [Lithospermum erythrorhizon]
MRYNLLSHEIAVRKNHEAMVAGLTIVKSLGINNFWVEGYSKLIMDQVRGVCGVRRLVVKNIMRGHPVGKGSTITHAQSEEVDHLSRLATTYYDELPRGVHVEIRESPTYEKAISLPVLEELR